MSHSPANLVHGLAVYDPRKPGAQAARATVVLEFRQGLGDILPDILRSVVDVVARDLESPEKPPHHPIVRSIEILPRFLLHLHGIGRDPLQQTFQILLCVRELVEIRVLIPFVPAVRAIV